MTIADAPGPADLRAPRRTRIAAFVAVALLHVAAIFLLLHAFAPEFTATVADTVLSTFSVTVETPPTSPPPSKAPDRAGAQGEEGRKAIPRAVAAPPPKVVIATTPAPRASSIGNADTSGAGAQGSGTGAGGAGSGTGSGAGGNGSGRVTRPVLISGRIDNARDFPIPEGGREARVGKSVTLALTVGTNGRATACGIYASSGLPDTDAAACRLAIERLRFRPATNGAGEPVAGTYYWRQKFFF